MSRYEAMTKWAGRVGSARCRGQVTAEYFLLFAVIALATLLSLSSLDDDVVTTFQNLFVGAVNSLPLDDVGPPAPGGGPGGEPVGPPGDPGPLIPLP